MTHNFNNAVTCHKEPVVYVVSQKYVSEQSGRMSQRTFVGHKICFTIGTAHFRTSLSALRLAQRKISFFRYRVINNWNLCLLSVDSMVEIAPNLVSQ